MAHQKVAAAAAATCLKLEMKDVVLVKPSKSIPSSTLSVTMIDGKPDLDSLCPIVYAYRSSAVFDIDPADVIREALSKALLYYYPLAGRLMRDDVNDGKLRVMIKQESANEFGVPFIEANANCDLSSLHYLDDVDTEIAKHFHLPPPPTPSSQCHPPLVFMVTKFLCGGFTIGIGLSHALCDGFGASQFFHAILELARGRSEPSIKPIWERETLGKAMVGMGSLPKLDIPLQNRSINMSSSAVSPLILPNTVVKVEQVCVKVDSETIRRLKLSLMNEIGKNEVFTTFESIAACLWRSRARALNLSPADGKTMLHFLVGLRGNNFNALPENFHCPLPEGYYGNAIMDAKAIVTVKELNEKPLLEIVKLIKETKKLALTDGFIRSWFAKTKKNEPYDFELEVSGAVTVLTEWKHLGFMENMDFRGKEVVNVVPAPCDMFTSVSMCIFLSDVVVHPTTKDGGSSGGDSSGLRIFTTLPIAAIPKFREEMNATLSLYSNTT